MESTAPVVVTTPVYDAPVPKPETGFWGNVKSFFGRIFGGIKKVVRTVVEAVRPLATRAYRAVRSIAQRVTSTLPEVARKFGKPFLLLPAVFPKVWHYVGRAATWLYNHGPRQIQNFINQRFWAPLQRFISSRTSNVFAQMIPAVLDFAIWGLARKGLTKLGVPGMVASIGLFAVFSPGLKYIADLTDDNPTGQTVMAGASAGTIGILFVGQLMERNWSVAKALYYLVRWVAPLGGLVSEAVSYTKFQAEARRNAQSSRDAQAKANNVEVSPEEMGQRVADELRKDPANRVTLVQSKKNPNPKGRREVWLVQGHDVDVDAVKGFYWRDGIGYTADGEPVAVDLRGDLTRATRDRRRAQFSDEWAIAHPASA